MKDKTILTIISGMLWIILIISMVLMLDRKSAQLIYNLIGLLGVVLSISGIVYIERKFD